MRQVEVYTNPHRKNDYEYIGYLHGFGIGAGSVGVGSRDVICQETKAIVEKPDGTLHLVSLELIKFL